MRVLVYGLVGTNRGGIETFLLKMNKYMSSDTIFDYVVEGDKCIHENEINAKGGKIYFIHNRHQSPFKNIKDNKLLLKRLRKEYDVVYFNLSSLSWIKPIKIAIKEKYKVYIHSHNAEFIKANGSLLYRLINKYNNAKLANLPVERFSCSQPATEFMFGDSSNVEMVYNAINVEDFKFNKEKRNSIKKELQIENSFVLGFVGRLQYQKNPLFLVDIFEKVRPFIPNAKMLIVGEGDMRNELQNKINERGFTNEMLLLGNRTDVKDLLNAFDLFVLPSYHEGLPYVAVEAQTSGLMCFLSDRITREVDITNNVRFLSIDTDASNWKEAIEKQLNVIQNNDRDSVFETIKNSNFNIKNEAKRLERLLGNEK